MQRPLPALVRNNPKRLERSVVDHNSLQPEARQPQVLEEVGSTSDVKASDGFTQGYRNQVHTATPWIALPPRN